ncbi:MAG: hypothetical protein OJI70_01100 [Zavarzinia sp.]|nr:hypothetical protein [Zavarzinia sp.]
MTSFTATIDLAELDGDLVLRLDGGADRDRFGEFVGALGDVNGDGVADLAIAASGETTVWLGQWGPFDPAQTVGRSFRFDDAASWVPGDASIWAVYPTGIGDINGDGFADFDNHVYFQNTITHYYEYGDSWEEWRYYDYADIRYGGDDRATTGAHFGDSGSGGSDKLYLEGVGDVNGDGFDDVWVTAYSRGSPGNISRVVFGSPTGIPDNANSPGAPGLDFTGGTASVVDAAGDFNGDGIADLVISASSGDNSGIAVIFGRSDLATQAFDISTLDGTNGLWLPGAGSARSVGDVNGDGMDDIVVALSGHVPGDPFYVVYGRADAPASFDAATVDGEDGFLLLGVDGEVGAVGDINGDGRDDLLVGIVYAAMDYVIFAPADVGGAGLDVSNVDGDNGFQIVAAGVDIYGGDIVPAGDVNGDGIDDIAVGRGGENAVHIILGHAASAVNWVGTAAAEHHTGSLESDVLNGAGGNDLLRGLDGDDLLIGGSGGDILSGGEGIDTASFATGSHGVVVDLVAGTASGRGLGNDTLISIANVVGSTGDDDIAGTDGANRIDGNLGADRMVGRLGDDTYVVDHVGDVVVESRDQGIDTIETTLAAYALAADLENLTYTGTGDFTATGNTLANVIIGGAGNDELNGGRGSDTLRGGAGDDRYVVDHPGDSVEEGADGGFDTVETTLNYTLGDNVDGLLLRGTAALSGTGNALANALTGNGADNTLSGLGGDDTLLGKAGNDKLLGGDNNDRLDGGTGDDTLRGGLGDDTYVVDSAGDLLSEANGGGLDTVQSSVSFVLGSGFENLAIVTSQAVNGTGSSANNILIGGNGANILTGLRGNDTLTGAGGADIFQFGVGFGQDRITDFASSDVIGFVDGLFTDFAEVLDHATQVGADIVIAWSTGNTITIDDYLLEKLNAADFLFA